MRMVVDGGGLAIERLVNLDVRNEWVGSDEAIWDEKERVDDGWIWRIDGDMMLDSGDNCGLWMFTRLKMKMKMWRLDIANLQYCIYSPFTIN